jgi:hypothetical protein
MEFVRVVENGVEARAEIDKFITTGFLKEEIYVLAHDRDRSENLTDAFDINQIGVAEQGLFDTFANVFRSRGDELRAKLESLGLTSAEAEEYEEELDQGKVLVVAKTN